MLPHSELLLRLCLAVFLGSLIGLERERLLWAAGLRTHMLVCLGSCLIMIVSAFAFFDILDPEKNIVLDPSRMAAQVVSGIGFLGAGAILLQGSMVRGLTTAASIWAVAGIGLAVGGGLYLAAIASTFLILIILVVVKPLEERYKSRRMKCTLHFLARHGEMNLERLQSNIGFYMNYMQQFVVQPTQDKEYDEVRILFARIHRETISEIVDQLKKIPCVKENEIKVHLATSYDNKPSK